MGSDRTSMTTGGDQRGDGGFAGLDRGARLQLMKFICSFAWADLEIRQEERDFVARMIQHLGLDADEAQRVKGWLKVPPHPESVDPTEIPLEHRRLFVEAIKGIIEADGEVALEERENLDLLERLLACGG